MSPRTELWLARVMLLAAIILLVAEVQERDWVRAAAWTAATVYFGWLSRPRPQPQS